MRLIPPTWKGKLQALALIPLIVPAVYVVVTVVFWPAMSFVLAALFALYGALLTLLWAAFMGYLVWRRSRLVSLDSRWDEVADNPFDRW